MYPHLLSKTLQQKIHWNKAFVETNKYFKYVTFFDDCSSANYIKNKTVILVLGQKKKKNLTMRSGEWQTFFHPADIWEQDWFIFGNVKPVSSHKSFNLC